MMDVSKVVPWLRRLVDRLATAPAEAFDMCWDVGRRYFFTLAFLSLFLAKCVHLHAHIHSLPVHKVIIWSITFFFQDVIILLFFRIFVQRIRWRPLSALCALLVTSASLIMSGMASANTSFYVTTGAEIHWRQASTFNGDPAAMKTLLTGLTGFLIAEGALLIATALVARPIHRITGGLLHIWVSPFRWLLARLPASMDPFRRPRSHPASSASPLPDPEVYERINCNDDAGEKTDDEESDQLLGTPTGVSSAPPKPAADSMRRWVLVMGAFGLFLLLRALRPSDPVYRYLSGTLPLSPFDDGGHHDSPVVTTGLEGDYEYLNGVSALKPPPAWHWLPDAPLPGFSDWNASDRNALHYRPDADPLHIPNLQNPILEPISEVLNDGRLQIKHIVLIKLESTRADVFPLQNDSFMYHRIAETYEDKTIPPDVEARIANLTRTAEFLTGFPTGFGPGDHGRFGGRTTYGGISARNAVTTGTYTLKSLVGTLCGVTPLVADFNVEYRHHIYQPCLAQVFNALSQQPDITPDTEDFTRWPWHSAWMQSVTETYDKQDLLTPVLGYSEKQTRETIAAAKSPHRPEEVNYYGFPDTALRDYIREAIDAAEHNHRRLFLTHLTGTTHHPWRMPNNTYEELTGTNGPVNNDLNRYLNTIGFADDWLAEILDILEEKGVANETLVVLAGDHGLSLPNDGGVTPYDNPHVGSFQVPIVLAHPHLPPVEISTPVISDQIVPSILDLLIESGSVGPPAAKRAARDLRGQYEGQSLIRSLVPEQDTRQHWQFSVMNTGGSWLAVRSAARPQFRLVIPLVDDVEWRFSDLDRDPDERDPVQRLSLVDLVETIEEDYDEDALNWVRDAANTAKWWVAENWRRYQYNPEAESNTDSKNQSESESEFVPDLNAEFKGGSGIKPMLGFQANPMADPVPTPEKDKE
ncbi:alkaline phosphatase-like protein [Aspergillus campestris IBT 28561]|uniref:Alkaline phosphatase-like protein n=1 Tax=Aspergillus campestris (strain IBT 28561) TaxID=1392248 RepID=A0A2I1D890_ASPC2|nr:alkaline phosphatase-like protein [Aspergillus campestris IBT 28561]PKY06103.1 alkaline phosphatase-like protein [Aspergillus campestris IBT 28561]